MYLFEANLKLLANTLTPDIAQYLLEQNLTASCLRYWCTGFTERKVPMQYHAITDMCADKCMERQVCNDCTYRWNNVSVVLSEDVMLSIYFHFKFFNTLQNDMNEQNIQNCVIYHVFPHEKTCITFSLCDIKIYLFVSWFKSF